MPLHSENPPPSSISALWAARHDLCLSRTAGRGPLRCHEWTEIRDCVRNRVFSTTSRGPTRSMASWPACGRCIIRHRDNCSLFKGISGYDSTPRESVAAESIVRNAKVPEIFRSVTGICLTPVVGPIYLERTKPPRRGEPTGMLRKGGWHSSVRLAQAILVSLGGGHRACEKGFLGCCPRAAARF
jgi:hypothetical protein